MEGGREGGREGGGVREREGGKEARRDEGEGRGGVRRETRIGDEEGRRKQK